VLSEVICKAREDEGYVTEYCNILLYIMTLWLLLFDFMQFSQENEGVMHLGLFYWSGGFFTPVMNMGVKGYI